MLSLCESHGWNNGKGNRVTVTALMASGILDSSLQFHIQNAKNHGVAKEEMAELLTHAAFYAGWPKAWAALRMAKAVYTEGEKSE
ncbi:MAG: carboxymuconolactone decarboxylase family protein [Clostridiales bacterium]|nr:carboxymuconolactone decarboxylase family protein [Clostridiales bacterium]